MAFCRVSAERVGNTGWHGGPGEVSRSLTAAGGCMGCCVQGLQSFAPLVALLRPPGWERGAGGLFARPKGDYPCLKNTCCYCQVTNFDELRERELKFCRTRGYGSSPFLSFPKTHSLWYLTWDPIDIHVHAELWRFV